jgi:hypothetical protein
MSGENISPQGFAPFLQNPDFIKAVASQISKADTIDQSLGLLWYDLRPVVQLLYPFKELIPRISRLPRVPADGGNAFHWKRITAINVNNVSVGVSEGNRGASIALSLQDQQASYKTIGLESAVSFEARLGAKNLTPDALGTAVQSTLRSVMIGEEQTLMLGNASTQLGQTPTPTLAASGTGSSLAAGTIYVIAVALSGVAFLQSNLTNGVPGQITKTNTDGTTDTFGGGSAKASTEANVVVTAGQKVTATVTPVAGAVGYAWYVGTATGAERLAAITSGNQAVFTKVQTTTQLVTALQVAGAYVDNSTNALVPDGIISQIFGSVFGSAPSLAMSTNAALPAVASTGDTIAIAGSGALVYTKATGNTGLTISGTNIAEWDCILQAAYDQYKLGFDRILLSAQDIAEFMGQMLGQNAAAQFRIFFDADAENGRIVAGRRVTSYLNKFMNNTLDVEIHPFVPAGTQIFWSDRVPYELSGVPNILEAHVRMDYYQIQWPLTTRKYEYGCYVDEVFACYFVPAFAIVTNVQSANGTPSF